MKQAIVAGLCAAYGLYVFWAMQPGPATTPDSGTYLAMAPIVPLGYPIVLQLVGPGGAMVVQPIVFAIALGFLGFEILRLTSSVALAMSLLVATVLRPDLNASATQLNGFIASNRPLPLEREAFALSRQDTLEFRENEPVRFIQPAVIGLGWLTGGLALIGVAAVVLGRLPDSLAIASLAALVGHAGLLFSALFAAGISRFMITLWPAILVAVFVGAWYGVEQVAERRRATREARL